MAGRIPDQFIDEVLSRVDIADVIGERIELKRTGSNLQALCPFHGEKTPSFTVAPAKQFYHCFGCGAHGNAIGFLMEYDRMDFRDAVEHLARSVGLELPQTARDEAAEELAPVYDVLGQAASRYQQWLRNHPARQPAVDYLKTRGLSGEIAAEYAIGFAPSGRDNLIRGLGKLPLLLKAGLAGQGEQGQPYDRFRERVMFPIRDRRGRVIGFGGRVIGAGEPKYLNSPETPVFHKGRELYGLHECLQHNPRPPELVVVEGYMDVVALAQFGIRQAVATLGTATSTIQVDRLFQAARKVIFCFDGDRAGRAAAARALESALPAMSEGRQARFLFLPEGEDPDSLVRKEGVDGFRQRLEEARPLSEVFYEQLMHGIDMSSMDGRAQLVEKAAQGLRKLPFGIFREMMLERLAELGKVDVRRIEAMLAGNERPKREAAPAATKSTQTAPTRRPMRMALALLLQRPALANLVDRPTRFAGADVQGSELFAQLAELGQAEAGLTTGAVLERFRDSPHEAALWKLAAWDHLVPEAGIESEFRDAVAWLEAQTPERLPDENRLQYLNERFHQGALTEAERRELQDLLISSKRPTPKGA